MATNTQPLLGLVTEFLAANGFDKAAKEVKKQAEKKGIALKTEAVEEGTEPSLGEVFAQWQAAQPATTAAADDDSSSASSSSESEDSDSDSSESEAEAPPSKKRKASPTPSSSSSSDSGSSDSGDSEEESAPPAKKAKTVKKAASVSSSSASSSASSDSESHSESSDSEAESESSSDSESSSESESEASDSSSDSSSSSDSDSDSSSDSSSEDEKPVKKSKKDTKKPSKKTNPANIPLPSSPSTSPSASDSTATLTNATPITTGTSTPAIPEPDHIHPDRKRKLPASFSGPQTNISTANGEVLADTEENAKRLKKENIPFSRIPADQYVDPKFSSNAFVPYEYAQKAHQDLIVTKGKGFTKAKNKGKRGSYRGGRIETTVKGIKFDD